MIVFHQGIINVCPIIVLIINVNYNLYVNHAIDKFIVPSNIMTRNGPWAPKKVYVVTWALPKYIIKEKSDFDLCIYLNNIRC